MELAWTRFLDGLSMFKSTNAIFLIYVAFFLWSYCHTKQIDNKKWIYYILVSVIFIIFPITAIGALVFYTPFYDWIQLQTILPSLIVIPFILEVLLEQICRRTKKSNICGICIITFVLIVCSNFSTLESKVSAKNGIPSDVYEVLQALEKVVPDQEITIVAKHDIMSYARQYSARFFPAYGKDLWNLAASSYVEGAYTYEYDLYKVMEEQYCEEDTKQALISMMNEYDMNCYIIPTTWPELEELHSDYDKETLTSEYVVYFK